MTTYQVTVARETFANLLERRDALQEAIVQEVNAHQAKLAALMQELRQNGRQLDTMQRAYPLLSKERAE